MRHDQLVGVQRAEQRGSKCGGILRLLGAPARRRRIGHRLRCLVELGGTFARHLWRGSLSTESIRDARPASGPAAAFRVVLLCKQEVVILVIIAEVRASLVLEALVLFLAEGLELLFLLLWLAKVTHVYARTVP